MSKASRSGPPQSLSLDRPKAGPVDCGRDEELCSYIRAYFLAARSLQRPSAAMTSFIKPSIAAGSVQRNTATMSFSGSIQVRLPPAPRAQ